MSDRAAMPTEPTRPPLTQPAPLASAQASVALVAGTFVTGVFYVAYQWVLREGIEDALFISILIAATMILVFGMRSLDQYLRGRGLAFYTFVLATADPSTAAVQYEALCRSVLDTRRMLISGVVYGLLVGSSPVFLEVWPSDPALRGALALFLFSVNLVTGAAFYSLIAFFKHTMKVGRLITVDLWHLDNPSTQFLLGATRRVSIVASVYVSLSISSIIFSLMPIGALVVAYSGFAALVLLTSVFLPSLPIAQKLRDAKRGALANIDTQVQRLFSEMLEMRSAGDISPDLARLDSLLRLRDRIDSVTAWPFRMKSVIAALSVLFFSSVPVILQTVLERLIK